MIKNHVLKQNRNKNSLFFILLFCLVLVLNLQAQKPYGTKTSAANYADTYWLNAGQGVVTSSERVSSWTSAEGMVFNDMSDSRYPITYSDGSRGAGVMNYQPALVFSQTGLTSLDRSLRAATGSENNTSGYSTYVFTVSSLYNESNTLPCVLTFTQAARDNFGWDRTNKHQFACMYSLAGNTSITGAMLGSASTGKMYGISSYIIGNDGAAGAGYYETFQNGQKLSSGYRALMTNSAQRNLIGNTNEGGGAYYFSGTIQEIIVIKQWGTNNQMNQTDREKIHSYLAIKYGIALQGDQSYYYNSAATPVKVWDNAINGGYNTNVFGLARDDDFGLYQKQARSMEDHTISAFIGASTLASTNTANTGTLTNGTYLLFGSNGLSGVEQVSYAAGTPFQNMGLPTAVNWRYKKVLKTQCTGVASQNVRLYLSGMDVQYVMVSSSADFDPETTNIYAVTNGYSDEMTLSNGDYVSFLSYIDLAPPVAGSDLPLNVISDDMACVIEMEQNVDFDIQQKFIATPSTTSGQLQAFHIPLVGDLNGDGKPEIISLGKATNTSSLTMGIRYVHIFSGQDGSEKLKFDLTTLGTYSTDYYGSTGNTGGGFQTGSLPYHQSPSYMAIADVDRDGIGEIIIAQSGREGKVYCLKPTLDTDRNITGLTKIWDGEVGHKAPLAPTTGNTYEIYGQPSPQIADMNGDGIPEVVIYNKIYNAQTGKLIMAWGGTAESGASSSLNANTLVNYNPGDVSTNSTYSDNVKSYAMVGRRPSSNSLYNDLHLAVPAMVDFDGDGMMEIVTGSRIHKFDFNYLGQENEPGDHTSNTYATIDGPALQAVTVGTAGTTNSTYYFNDGFTRIADVDGDGQLDIAVFQNGSGTALDLNVLMYIWDYDFNTAASTLKAVSSFRSDGDHGTFGIPFVGDINGRLDGRDVSGGSFTKKLPEICVTSGRVYINGRDGTTGMQLHSASNMSNARFTEAYNRIIGITYDGGELSPQHRLKISWALEHQDYSDNTGITMFDFNNDGAFDLCYRDEQTLRVISPKLGGTDYIRYDNTTDAAILFRTAIRSETGFEAPAIADINRDGSADIIVAGYASGGYSANIYVYEHASGSLKWAPCPPVWNQALYNPLYINEDLTVPAKPQSMLTQYINSNGEIFTPYNGAWLQQPIVQKGQAYVPMYRTPDAVISDMKVAVNYTGTSATSATITLAIRNYGTASINSTTPIAFYYNAADVDDFSVATHIVNRIVGEDIFAGETYTVTYNITGDFKNKLVWARIMDNGTTFPVSGYDECNTTNNLRSAIDCPYMDYTIASIPAGRTEICGDNGVIVLTATNTNTQLATPVYTWYKEDTEIPNSNSPYYFATEAGDYRCYVFENTCRAFSNTYSVTKTEENGDRPVLSSISADDPKICGTNGSVYLYMEAYGSDNPSYYFYKDTTLLGGPLTAVHITVSEPGVYMGVINVDGCTYRSNTITVIEDDEATVATPGIESVYGNRLCDIGGSTLLQVTTPDATAGVKYQWFRNDVHIEGATDRWYIARTSGTYKLSIVDEAGCSAFSNNTIPILTEAEMVAKPIIAKTPNMDTVCVNGGLLMEVANHNFYNNATYIWYKNGSVVQTGGSRFYQVKYENPEENDARYFVAVQEEICTAISEQETISFGDDIATTVEIESVSGSTLLCGAESALILTIVPDDTTSTQTYQWLKNGERIAGEAGDMLIVKTTGTYTLLVIDGDCSVFSNDVVVTPGMNTTFQAPVLVIDPASGQLCGNGSHVLLSVDNHNFYSNPIYHWHNGLDTLASSANPYYFATTEGNYFVKVSDADVNCSAISSIVAISNSSAGDTISDATISSISDDTELCGTTGVVILQLATGNFGTGVSYVWFRNGTPYTSHANYNQPMITVSEEGTYYLRVIEGECSTVSNEIVVTQSETGSLPDYDFRRLPATGQICTEQGSIYLYVHNSGSYPNAIYSWLRDDVVVKTSTAPWYNATSAGDYKVIISSGGCVIETTEISLKSSGTTMNRPIIAPTIGDHTICDTPGVVVLQLSNPSSFTAITGHQWFKDGLPITGATASIYIARTAGDYQLQIMESTCSSLSDVYTVEAGNSGSVVYVPQLSSDPGLVMCATGGRTQISVENANVFPDATYLWYRNNVIIHTGTEIAYYVNQTGTYFVQAYYNGCSSVSAEKTITTISNTIATPVVGVEPASAAICGDDGAVVIRLTNHIAHGTYQWYKNGMAIESATATILTVDTSMGAGAYRLRIQNGFGCVTYSDRINVSYYDNTTMVKPVISSPTTLIYPDNPPLDEVTLTVDNVDPNVSQYIWYDDDDLLRRDANSGTISYVVNRKGNFFVQAVYETTCSAVSNTIYINDDGERAEQPIVDAFPVNKEMCLGSGVGVIEITNLDAYTNPAFAWMLVGSPDSQVGTDERFVTSTPGAYYVIVTDYADSLHPLPSVPSEAITFTQGTAEILQPIIVSTGNKICGNNGRLILYVQDYDTRYTGSAVYRWMKDGVEVQYRSEAAYVVSEAGEYYVQVRDGDCFAESARIIITSDDGDYANPHIVQLGGNAQVCGDSGTMILRIANISQFTGATFQWFRNEIPLAGETDSLLRVTLDNSCIETDDYYRVQATFSDDCSTLSDRKLVVSVDHAILTKPLVERIPAKGKLCGDNGSVFLRITNIEIMPGDYYYWFKNETIIVQQGANPTYEATEPGSYTVYVAGDDCATESEPEVIEKTADGDIEKPVIASPAGNLCANYSGLLLLMTTAESTYANPSYQWYRDTTVLPGETKPYLVASIAGDYRLQVSTEDGCSAFSNIITVQTNTGSVTKPIISNGGYNTICETGGRILTQVTNYSSFTGATYNWYSGNTLMQSSSSHSYYADTPGDYYVQVVTSAGCSAVSDETELVSSDDEIAIALLRAIPEEGILCGTNGRVLIGLTNPGDYIGYAYQWYRDNFPLSGQSGMMADIPELFLTVFTAGTYRIRITGGDCITFSDPMEITSQDNGGVTALPIVDARPINAKICGEDGIVRLQVRNATGLYPAGTTYIWYQNNIMVKNSADAFFLAEDSAAAGIYFLQVILPNGCSGLTYPGTPVTYDNTVIPKPTITSQPSENKICGDHGVVLLSLSDSINYTDATYRWYRDDTYIAGATSANYKATVAGNYYLVIISDECATLSDSIHVTKITSDKVIPRLSFDPSANLCGSNSSIIATVINAAAFTQGSTYIWFKGDEIIAQGTDMYIYEVTTAGTYSVIVVDGTCATLSVEQEIDDSGFTLTNVPVVTPAPASAVICGTNGAVELTFSNYDLFGSQYTVSWYKNNVLIPETTGRTIHMATTEGEYRVKAAYAGCAAFSAPVNVTLDPAGDIDKPVLAMYPSTGYLCANGGSVIIYINQGQYADGTIYKWYRGETVVQTGTKNTYETTAIGNYHVVVSEGDSVSYSATVSVTSGGGSIAKPVIVSTSGDNTICETEGSIILMLNHPSYYGENATFQWFDGNNSPIAGDTNALIIVTAAGNYRIQVSQGTCTAISLPFEVTKDGSGDISAPVLLKDPVDGQLCGSGSMVLLYVEDAAATYPNATYNWFKDNVLLSENSSILNATEEGTYFVQVVEDDCSSVSDSIIVNSSHNTINTPSISIAQINIDTALCGNTSAILLILGDQSNWTGYNYQWYKDGIPIKDTLTYTTATTPGNYYLRVYNADCAAFSDTIQVNITDGTDSIVKPVLSVSPSNGELCGSDGLVTINITNYEQAAEYAWYKDGQQLSAATHAYLNATREGIYAVVVQNTAGCTNVSDYITITRGTSDTIIKPVLQFIPDGGQLCGTSAEVTLFIGNHTDYANPLIAWYKDHVYLTQADTITVYEEGDYFAIVYDGDCASASGIHTIAVINHTVDPALISLTGNLALCGTNSSLILTVENTSQYDVAARYRWYKDNTFFADTTSFLEISEPGDYFVKIMETSCVYITDTLTIIDSGDMIAMPAFAKIPSSGVLCGDNGEVLLTWNNSALFNPGAALQWYKNDTLLSGKTDTTLAVTEPGRYRLFVDDDGCSAFSAEISMERSYDIPVIDHIKQDTSICYGNSIDLKSMVQWAATDTILYFADANGEFPLASPVVAPLSDSLFFFKLVNKTSLCESDMDTLNITVRTLPVCGITGPDTVCPGSITAYVAPDHMRSYAWSITGSAAVTGSTDQHAVSIQAADTCQTAFNVSLTLTDSNGCVSSCHSAVRIASPSIKVTAPANKTVEACDLAFVAMLADTFHVWKSGFGFIEAGCAATTPDLADSLIVYDRCSTVSKTIYYIVQDACSMDTAFRTFTVLGDKVEPQITGTLIPDTICMDAAVPAGKTTIAELEVMGLTVSDNCTEKDSLVLTDVLVSDYPMSLPYYTRYYIIADQCGNKDSVAHDFIITPNPLTFHIIASPYCDGGSGGTIRLTGSQTGVVYQLKNGDGSDNGAAKDGTGNPIVWEHIAEGANYHVTATNTSIHCQANSDSTDMVKNSVPEISIPKDSVAVLPHTEVPIPVTFTYGGNMVVHYSAMEKDGTVVSDTFGIKYDDFSPYNWIFTTPGDTGTYYIRIDSAVTSMGCKAMTDSVFILHVYDCKSDDFNLVCPADTILELPYGVCEYAFSSIGIPVITDNPSGNMDTIYNNAPVNLSFSAGVYYVDWIAVDECGKSDTCRQIVIVNAAPCGMDQTVYYFDNSRNVLDSLRTVYAMDYEGNKYKTVLIDCDCWTAENLVSTKYADGRDIGSHYIYYADMFPDTNANLATFGRLYTWNAATDGGHGTRLPNSYIQGACPDGWLLPSVDDYAGLITYETDALNANTHWLQGGGHNSTGFTALPAGLYNADVNRFYYLLGDTYFWSSTEINDQMAKACRLFFSCPDLLLIDLNKGFGASIRCVKSN
ncbi:MAG: hypothetical protein LBV02_04540 [Bacteroidales bacterium]|jgi:uncharacterized protein (TIGR02145 family)|nr:hypothetical protein [Bacteroidales bacterium]